MIRPDSIQISTREKNGKTEYAYVFAGTADKQDIKEDVLQSHGGKSPQYMNAVLNASKLSTILKKNKELTFIGHSLGGGEAALSALVTDRKAITFNAAGLHNHTKAVFGVLNKGERNIDAYIVATDPLNSIQNRSRLPHVNGIRILLLPYDWKSRINGHVMDSVLRSVGVREPVNYNIDK